MICFASFFYFPPPEEEIDNAGILSVGGLKAAARHGIAEIFNPKTGRSCKIGDLPVATDASTICGNLACGGFNSEGKSCSWFDGVGTFTALPVSLKEERAQHLCWLLPSGEVLLLGGGHSTTTTERLSADGTSSTADFDLPYDIKFVLILKINNESTGIVVMPAVSN